MKRAKKTLWLIYAVVLCFAFFRTAAAVSVLLGFSEGQYILLNGAAFAILVLFVVFPLKLFSARKNPEQDAEKERKHDRKEDPLSNKKMHGRRRGGVRLSAVCTFAFCLAAILTAARLIRIPSGSLYMGQHSQAVFFRNLFFQTAGSILAFAALYSLSGVWSAGFMMVGVIVLSPLSTGIYVADPQNFLFFAAGEELLCLSVVCRLIRKLSGVEKVRILLGIVGFLSGLLCLVDVRLCAFLLLPLGDFSENQRIRKQQYPKIFLFLASAASGFFCGAAIWCAVFGKSGHFGMELTVFLSSWFFMEKVRTDPVMLHSPLFSEYVTALVCYLAAFLPLFFGSAQRARGTLRWIFPFLCLFVMEGTASVGLQGQALRFLTLSAMAGAAVTGIFAYREPTAIGVIMKRKKTVLENTAAQPVPGEYLENPLPVPRRHVKKEMNYGFEPAPEQMYYEIPVADNDDFDV